MRFRPRVLVVDDDPDIRAVIATRLRAANYEVGEAGDGEEAIRAVRAAPVDVVVLDVRMPGLSGYQVLERLHDDPAPPSVLLVSALGELEDRLKGLYGGAVDYITKPFQAEELVARVSAAARQKALLDEARGASFVDPLTGLGNRRDFERNLEQELLRAERHGQGLGLVLLDADGLKQVNDTWGHPAGDAFLRAVARVLRTACRGSDRAARIGGDEFALLVSQCRRSDVEQCVRRLRAGIAAEEYETAAGPGRPSVSVGFALYPEDAGAGDALLHAADEALYRAKGARVGS